MTTEEIINKNKSEFEKMPGITVIHEIEDFKPLYMTSNGLKLLGLSLEELIALKEDYQRLFFNPNFIDDYLLTLKAMLSSGEISETYTLFHQVMIDKNFQWYAASIKAFKTDKNLRPTHTITYAVPLEEFNWTMRRAERLLEETEFARKNLPKFSRLSPREKEVVALASKGKKTALIAEKLGVSAETVNSHLKSIKKKLRITTSYELTEFAMAYDLL